MFKKKTNYIVDIDSLIGEDIKIIGNIEGKGNLRVDGTIEGDINYDGNIVIGETGKVQGSIKSGDVSLAGTIKGNVTSKTKLVILPTGKLIGDVQVPNFIIQENAKFQGTSKMINLEGGENKSEKPKLAKSKST